MEPEYKPHTPRLESVDQYIRDLFENELPATIEYHDSEHTLHPTRGVVAVSNRIALAENIPEHDRELLIAAAYFHDTGYVREYDKNEPIGARMAGRILRLIGYSQTDIEQIQKMILATDLAREPQSLVEKILCDADLDHLGRDDFLERDSKLRKGRRARGIDVGDQTRWYRGTLDLIENHEYYTASQRALRDGRKQENIRQLKEMLADIEKSEG